MCSSKFHNLVHVSHKIPDLQILELKKKQESQVQLLKEKQKSDEAAKKLQEEIHFIKSQKVAFPLSACLITASFSTSFLCIVNNTSCILMQSFMVSGSTTTQDQTRSRTVPAMEGFP